VSALLEQLNESMGDVVERAGQSLVRVSAGGRGFGAGSVWHSDGLTPTLCPAPAEAAVLAAT